MNTGILVLTNKALSNAISLKKIIGQATIYAPVKLLNDNLSLEINYYDNFADIVNQAFKTHNNLIFIMATGIVVRTIAPYIKDKTLDPAVLVMDEELKFCISLIGGHIAGANKLAKNISDKIGSIPVITTATDVNEKGALDLIAYKLNAYNDSHRDLYKKINYDLASSNTVYLISDFDTNTLNLDIRGFKQINPIDAINITSEYIIHLRGAFIGDKTILEQVKLKTNYFEIIPSNLVLGIGCRRNTSINEVTKGLDELSKEYLIDKSAIKVITSIDIKKDEQGIIELAKELNAEFITYNQAQLSEIVLDNDSIVTSEFVKTTVGTGSVSEASAHVASKGKIILKKQIFNKVTFAIGIITQN